MESRLVCAGCGVAAPDSEPLAPRCGAAAPGDDVDHVVSHRLTFGDDAPELAALFAPADPETDATTNPFVRFRRLSRAYHVARARGLSDQAYVDLVRDLDERVAAVDGRGFRVTALSREPALAARAGAKGPLLVKNETANVTGSHKARHLMGLAIALAAADATGLAPSTPPSLAIASCGNAALAAAVVARAASRPLTVFVPTWADAAVIARLEELGAFIVRCAREPHGPPGDPCYHAFVRAVRGGAYPFTCQGSENGLTIDGGKTLGWELAAQAGAELERLFVQVGGGALTSAIVQGLRDAVALGVLPRLPQLYPVQSEGAHPLERAHARVVAARAQQPDLDALLAFAAHHRSEFMWPLEHEPKSVATGILDDETYDWLEIVRGVEETGGAPLVVSDETIVRARDDARELTGIQVDATGAAGLAGVYALAAQGAPADPKRGETVPSLAILTGAQR